MGNDTSITSSAGKKRRVKRARGLSLLITLVLLAGGVAGHRSCAPSERKIKDLIIDAATWRHKDYRRDPETLPLINGALVISQPGSWASCADFIGGDEIPEFEIDPGIDLISLEIKPNTFWELLEQTHLLRALEHFDLRDEEPYPDHTIIRNENITGLKMTREGNSIAGTIYFQETNFHGAIDFVARKGPAGWRVEEFILPVMGLHLDRISDTSWRARTPFRADGWLPTYRKIDRENPATVRISSGESLTVEVDGRQELVYPQTMRRYLTERTVRVLADGDVTAGQIFEVLDKLRSLANPCTQFYLASEPCRAAGTIRIAKGPVLVTSGAPFRKGQLGDAAVAGICMTKSSLYLSTYSMARAEHFENIFSFISNVLGVNPGRPFFLAVDPNTPASRVVTILDRLAESNAQRVVFSVGSIYRGVLFELVGGKARKFPKIIRDHG